MRVDLRRFIFPLFKFKGKETPTDIDFLGTCFFMQLDRWLLLFTARHNLNWNFPPDEKYKIAEWIEGKVNWVTIEGGFTKNKNEDISFIILKREAFKEFKNPINTLPPLDGELPPGQDVFTLGFPLTIKEQAASSNVITIHENTLVLKGYIQNIVTKDRIRDSVAACFEKNYCLSFPSLEGLSGAPLLTVMNDTIHVAGIIYANWCVDYKLRDKEIICDGAETSTHTVSTRYEFGLASTVSPILKIRELFADFEKKKESK